MDVHHILPRSMGGGNQAWNLLQLCPGCHRKIFVPGMSSGMHAVEAIGSIVVFGYLLTSDGRGLHYRLQEIGKEFVWFHNKRENMGLSEPLC